MNGETLQMPARMGYGVEFAGGVFDRFVLGTAEPGNHGMTIYFERSTPWVLSFVGWELFRPDSAEAFSESYDPPWCSTRWQV